MTRNGDGAYAVHMRKVCKDFLADQLIACDWNMQRAANATGLNRTHLYDVMKRLDDTNFLPQFKPRVRGADGLYYQHMRRESRAYLQAAMARNGNSVEAAARDVDLDRSCFYRYLHSHDIPPPRRPEGNKGWGNEAWRALRC